MNKDEVNTASTVPKEANSPLILSVPMGVFEVKGIIDFPDD